MRVPSHCVLDDLHSTVRIPLKPDKDYVHEPTAVLALLSRIPHVMHRALMTQSREPCWAQERHLLEEYAPGVRYVVVQELPGVTRVVQGKQLRTVQENKRTICLGCFIETIYDSRGK